MHPITVSMRQVSSTAAAAALPATQRVMQCESGLVAGPLHHAQTESSIQCLTLPEPLTDKVSACRLQLLQSALFLSPPARPQDTPLAGPPRRPCHHHRGHRHRGRRAPHNPTKENYRRTCRLIRVSPAITRRTHARTSTGDNRSNSTSTLPLLQLQASRAIEHGENCFGFKSCEEKKKSYRT